MKRMLMASIYKYKMIIIIRTKLIANNNNRMHSNILRIQMLIIIIISISIESQKIQIYPAYQPKILLEILLILRKDISLTKINIHFKNLKIIITWN
jgi:hypothetical protein